VPNHARWCGRRVCAPSQDASGWFRLLNANVGRQRHFAVRQLSDWIDAPFAAAADDDMHDADEDLVVVDDSDDGGDDDDGGGDDSDLAAVAGFAPDGGCASVRPVANKNDAASACGSKGKTPYTLTMKLQKGPRGYGFSVTWTHPPR